MLKQIDFDEMAVKIKLNVTKLMIKFIYLLKVGDVCPKFQEFILRDG